MTDYSAPLQDFRFVLEQVADLPSVTSLPAYQEATDELVSAVLQEAGRFSAEVLAPLNQTGDQQRSRLENGVVRTPDGFRDAYAQFVAGGWNTLPFDPAFGGQGLPWAIAVAVQEMWQSANMSFALCPLLTQGAVDLLQTHGTEAQKAVYLEKLISGQWTGTMNLTEPQAGSDVGAVRTKAQPEDGFYRIKGQKVFITYGDHDLAENIVHMVLARTPDAPAGSKGLSLFLVPKFLPATDGTPGKRNDLHCLSLEHKLGIHASPTAVMSYGDNDGATGYLIGELGQGMACMFTMMNNARLSVGIQGLAIAERALQQALSYAQQRRQSRALGDPATDAVTIIQHPDVRRMIMTMKANCEAMRALLLFTAAELDKSRCLEASDERQRHQALVDVLIPIAKAWCTDLGCEVASLGVQVHGGVGYIEETGAAQYFRDARIAPIYEGTNGIQALDLLSRKLLRDKGQAVNALLEEMRATLGDLEDPKLATLHGALGEGLMMLESATDWLLDLGEHNLPAAAAGATPYLKLFGTVAGGWLLAKSAHAAAQADARSRYSEAFVSNKIAVARFYAANLMPAAALYGAQVIQGAETTLALEPASL